MGHGRLRASFGRPHRTRPGEIRKAVSGARTAGDQRHASVPDDGGQRPQAGGLPGARPERTIRRHGGDRPMIQDLPDEMFRWIVEAMPEAVVYSDREGIIRLWNRSAETIFGHRREDALGHTLDLIIPELLARTTLGRLSHGHADRRDAIRARGAGGSRHPERRDADFNRVLYHSPH